jgi:hypothetical protein
VLSLAFAYCIDNYLGRTGHGVLTVALLSWRSGVFSLSPAAFIDVDFKFPSNIITSFFELQSALFWVVMSGGAVAPSVVELAT